LLAVIALDGENCWDFYEANGNHFLAELYRRLSKEPELLTVTVSEFLDRFPGRSALARIQPGSWINGTLDTWVGDPEHNAAWEQLAKAREQAVLAEAEAGNAQGKDQARRELLIAEGSDWFWWFGRSHDSGMDLIWDNLFRLHLRNVYLALGKPPPTALFHSFLSDGQGSAWKRPAGTITPRVHGAPEDSEWDAAGYVDVSALFGAMHPPRGAVQRIWFGHDEDNLYLRFDLLQEGEPALRISLYGGAGIPGNGFRPAAVLEARRQDSAVNLRLIHADGDPRPDLQWVGQTGGGRSYAFAIPFSAVPLSAAQGVHMVAEVCDKDGKPVQQLPPGGSITVRPAADPGSNSQRPLKILLVSAEVSPFAKVGGLADVAGALPKALKALGHDVRVAMPRYGTIDPDKHGLRRVLTALPVPLADQPVPADIYEGRIGADIPVYLVDNPGFFDREGLYGFWDDDARFVYFSRAALELLKPLDFQPDVIHVNDWHSAVIPNLLNRLYLDDPFFQRTATVLTIHNLAFQGSTGYGTLHLAGLDRWGLIKAGAPGLDDVVNLLGRGVHFSDGFNTVSQRYAREILTPEFGEGMDPLLRRFEGKLRGIRNGIDTEIFNPSTDPNLEVNYGLQTIEGKVENKLALQRELGLPEDRSLPVIGLISRLYDQKGLDLIANILWGLMRLRLQFVVLGAGEPRYEDMFRALARDNQDKVSTTIGFRPALAQKIYGGADFFMMPSRFEPCGLGQLISLRYATIPIVRATGGLADSVEDWDPLAQTGNGFVFTAYDHWDLYAQVVRGLETYRQPAPWRRLQANAMQTEVGWSSSARQYVDLYRAAIGRHAEAGALAGTVQRPYSW
jgi:starch synthase